jgi:hypothetical protein
MHPAQIAKRFTADGVQAIDIAFECPFGTIDDGIVEVNVRYLMSGPRRFIVRSPDKFASEDNWRIIELDESEKEAFVSRWWRRLLGLGKQGVK